MNIMKIATTTIPWSLEAFGTAIAKKAIEEYKESLVPVAWGLPYVKYEPRLIATTTTKPKEDYKKEWIPLYTLGETK